MSTNTRPPPGLTNFMPTMRDLLVLRAWRCRDMSPQDIADFADLCERADAWLTRLTAPVQVNEQPKQPA